MTKEQIKKFETAYNIMESLYYELWDKTGTPEFSEIAREYYKINEVMNKLFDVKTTCIYFKED